MKKSKFAAVKADAVVETVLEGMRRNHGRRCRVTTAEGVFPAAVKGCGFSRRDARAGQGFYYLVKVEDTAETVRRSADAVQFEEVELCE